MRTLEMIIIALLAIRLFAGLRWSTRLLDWLSIAALFLSGLHAWLEGWRWQMIPAYIVALGLALLGVIHILGDKPGQGRTRKLPLLKGILILILFLILLLPPLLLPVPEIYSPTGPYQVGTFSVMLVDQDRAELYADVPNGPRRLMVQVWYPAEPEAGASFGPWVEEPQVIAPAIAEFLGFPSFFLDHLEYANGNAYPDAPLSAAKDKYPLLLFSHGWSGFRAQNTFQMVSLASHGYVVAAPDHTYGAIATIFPDGQIAYNNPLALPTGRGLPQDEFLTAAQQLGEQWSGDLSFILDTLTDIDPGTPLVIFQDHLNFDQVGALGHSTGGGAALQFCVQDSRCQAVLGMDPYMEPINKGALTSGTDAAIMAMFSESWSSHRDDNSDLFEELRQNSTNQTYRFTITGTEHFDFSDLPAFSPLAATFGLKGPISAERALKIITDYTLAFFDQHLLGVAENLLDPDRQVYDELMWR